MPSASASARAPKTRSSRSGEGRRKSPWRRPSLPQDFFLHQVERKLTGEGSRSADFFAGTPSPYLRVARSREAGCRCQAVWKFLPRLLATGTAAPAGAAAGAPPNPRGAQAHPGPAGGLPQEGDISWFGPFEQAVKHRAPGGAQELSFDIRRDEDWWFNVQCKFPPNEDYWLAEIDKVIVSPRKSELWIELEVLSIINPSWPVYTFDARLMRSDAIYLTSVNAALDTGEPWTG